MRRNGAELFLKYTLNYRQSLEDDISQLQQNLRYRKIDSLDCLELALAKERLDSFNEFSDTAMALLGLKILNKL